MGVRLTWFDCKEIDKNLPNFDLGLPISSPLSPKEEKAKERRSTALIACLDDSL